MRRLDYEKKELSSRFGVLYSTLKRFMRVLDDGQQHQQNQANSNKSPDVSGKFLQPLNTTLGNATQNFLSIVQPIVDLNLSNKNLKCPC